MKVKNADKSNYIVALSQYNIFFIKIFEQCILLIENDNKNKDEYSLKIGYFWSKFLLLRIL